MKIFQVPQRKVPVVVRLAGGRQIEGALFAPESGPDGRPGRLIDRLNGEEEHFLPLVSGSGRFVIAKRALQTIDLAAGAEDPVTEEEAAGECRIRVRIALREGRGLEGRIRYSGRPEQRRVLDYLNHAPSFIRLVQESGTTYVRRDSIVSLEETGSDPT